MDIIRFSINRPVTIIMIFLSAIVFGLVSLDRLRLKLLPDISYPTLTVQTEYPDAAPMEVENFVTRPLEEAVGVVPGLRHVRSVSKPGLSEITLEFAWKTPMDYAALDVREKIDLIQLPKECEPPVILRYDPSLDPIIRIGVYGIDNLVRLRNLADRIIKKDLESLEGVASAKILGGLEEEIHVELDEKRLALFGVPIELVGRRLSQDNVNQSGGRLRDRGSEFLLRTENEFKNVDDVRATIIQENTGRKIVLADLGSIDRGYREREIITRLNGSEAVEVAIYKEGDANTVEVAKAIQNRLRGLRKQLPEDIKVEILFDQSQFIEQAIGEVQSNAVLGAILAVIVLFLFLRDLRSTLLIGLSIPISVMVAFMLMRQFGVSLNLMSLGGLALGVGMLVDNSIVVLESISRFKDSGKDRAEAALAGAGEVGRAVIASTLTTVAVFLPIVFVEGMAGQIFKDQALTVSVSLMASLMVALMLIPMISALQAGQRGFREDVPEASARLSESKRRMIRGIGALGRVLFQTVPLRVLKVLRRLNRSCGAIASKAARPFLSLFDRGYRTMERRYLSALEWALAHRRAFLLSMLLFFCFTIALGRLLGSELIPQFSQGDFSFNIQLPEGSALSATDSKIREMEDIIRSRQGIATYYSSVGTATRQGSNVKSKDTNIGQINIVLKNRNDKKSEARLIEELRREFAAIEGMTFKFARPMYFSFQTPIEVNVFGYNLDELKEASDRVMRAVEGVPGIKDVKTTMEIGSPELNVVFDRDRLASLGLQLETVSNILKNKVYGDVPTKLREMEREVDIRVRTAAWRADDADMIKALVVGERDGSPIFLGSVASVEPGSGLNQITRISQQRAAVVSGNISGRDLSSVTEDITSALAKMRFPSGVTVELGGQNEELMRSFRNLVFALVLAVFLVYLVMASQFESFIHPFIILFTVPMGLIGVVWILLLTGNTVSVVVLIGVILLCGIVVNNAIVLVD
ncbi:MAG: efflux RND transporter permease subunit [Chitinivibrionia bacterium]|nr:efflux RND transporter permease subunit [Chitinivibrionia bacterium]